MTDELLQGLHIAVTRPIDQAESIVEAIHHHGGKATLFPLLAIAPLEDYSEFDAKISTLDQADWAIFISTNAVDNALPRILRRLGKIPEDLQFAAIGHQTAKELALYGVHQVLTPHTRFDSETLLALSELQNVADKTVFIFRGVGGREVLADTLKSRGANVVFAESYCRINPQKDTLLLDQLYQRGLLDAMVITSSEAMRHLIGMAEKSEWLKYVTLCVNHARIAESPLQLGLKVLVAEAPGDDAMIQCLSKVKLKSA